MSCGRRRVAVQAGATPPPPAVPWPAGVIWRGESLLPGIAETLTFLRKQVSGALRVGPWADSWHAPCPVSQLWTQLLWGGAPSSRCIGRP